MSAERNIGACPNFIVGEWGGNGVCLPLLKAAIDSPGDPRVSQVICSPSNQADYVSHVLPNLTKGRDGSADGVTTDSTSGCPLVGTNFLQARIEGGFINTTMWTDRPYLLQEE